jgi:hypothetical protein
MPLYLHGPATLTMPPYYTPERGVQRTQSLMWGVVPRMPDFNVGGVTLHPLASH